MSASDPMTVINYQYDSANRLINAGGADYTWDNNGNLLSDGVNAYVYDSANRLISINGTTNYAYNGLGDRVKQNGTTYALDMNTGLTQVLSDGTNTYTYGLSRISQRATDTEYFLGDALGSVRQLTNASGEVTYAKSYTPYGESMISAGEEVSAYGFTGEQQDASGLTYLRARYYNAADGRFLNRDTWGGDARMPMSYSAWLYTYANPINATDPSGYITEKQSKKAELILEKLNNIYGVQIKKDWGYLNEFIDTDNLYIEPSLGCEWIDGNWRSPHQLELVLEAVRDLTKAIGPQEGLFNTAMRWQPVRIYRLPMYVLKLDQEYTGWSYNNVILMGWTFGGTDLRAKEVIVHELAHVMDWRNGWPPMKLSRDMLALTKSFKKVNCVKSDWGIEICDQVYDPNGNEPAPTDRANDDPWEDWAESFRLFVYPSKGILGPIRKNYIENFIRNLRTP